ncbi:FAD-dependent oxidoreductase [Rhizobium sp. XQZ8]|uniref:FAD-dependent oxidoreductase n=1 Tax=Rhizobium populisoli TaxID=2859785 RepID=UPI001CA4A68B|nr:FAD-dependent oxidoreductase [Rhizobium populisoli]MBW6425809.1 FAD-dependent oxidoreductase [Rhizobium populisoli]
MIAGDDKADVVIIGAGAAGLCAALAAREAGLSVTVLERDAEPAGNTAMTLGMLPGAGTRFQREKGIEDSPELFLADIMKKAKGKTDEHLARAVAQASGPAVEWLHDRHGVHFELLDDILYPGHAVHRYHVPKSRTGVEMEANLLAAAKAAGARIVTGALVQNLFAAEDGRVEVVGYSLNGEDKAIGAGAIVLATGGYGADTSIVAQHIPGMAEAVYCGHHGSTGDALRWGEALGAATADLGGYQGHCVADGPNLPVTWALVIRGGFQVNNTGKRFSNEMSGYSEQASEVLDQPGGTAWTIYDKRCEEPALTFQDYHRVLESGSVMTAESIGELAAKIGVPHEALQASFDQVRAAIDGVTADRFGRDFTDVSPLEGPFLAVRVRGALFHTQGGLMVDTSARVLRPDGSALPNLFAAGGAARGLSGPASYGYLGGNGLLTAVVLGRFAGEGAAALLGHARQTK